jgi:hypothetical protein
MCRANANPRNDWLCAANACVRLPTEAKRQAHKPPIRHSSRSFASRAYTLPTPVAVIRGDKTLFILSEVEVLNDVS